MLTKVFIYTLFSNPNLKCNPYKKHNNAYQCKLTNVS